MQTNKNMSNLKEKAKEAGYILYGDPSLADEYKEGKKGEIQFFKLGTNIDPRELAEEYKLRNLIPAHPQRILEEWDGERDVATQWGDNCFATFLRWNDERNLNVDRNGDAWGDLWWFAGVPADSPKNSDTKTSDLDTLPSELIINGVRYKKHE